MKNIFSTKLEPVKIPFRIQKLTIFIILIFIDVLEIWIKHKRNILKWLQNYFIED